MQEDMRLHIRIFNRPDMNSALHDWAKHKACPARYMMSHDRAFATQTGELQLCFEVLVIGQHMQREQ
jgi:hypothetical protein